MWKNSDIKLLLSLLLIPASLLVGCDLEKEDSLPYPKHKLTENISNIEAQNLEEPLNDILQEESFKDIQKTYKQFHELLEIFLGKIDKLTSNSNNLELINTYKINQKLKEIEAKINQYQNNLQTTDSQSSEVFDNINLIVNKIKPITEQFKKGLAKESIGKVQIHLGNLVSGPSDQFYGLLGPNTRTQIRVSLTGNSQQLETKLTQLSIIGLVRELVSKNQALSTKVGILEKEVRELRNKTNAQIQMILIFSVAALGVAVMSTCFSVYRLFKQTGTRKKLSSSRSDKKHDTASQADARNLENISRLETNQEVDHSGKNIPQPEKNQGINMEQSPIQSSTTTPIAVAPASFVETYPDTDLDMFLDLERYLLEDPSLSNPQFVSSYNQGSRSLSNNATAVAETEESINQRAQIGNKSIILEKKTQGSYWILKENIDEYMVPKYKININEHNLDTVENLFECQEYRPEYSGFQLIKPAKVSAISKGETWQLVERGILQFD